MHAGQLGVGRLGNVDVHRLALVDESAAIGRHPDDHLLRYLPHCLVQSLHVIRNVLDVLPEETACTQRLKSIIAQANSAGLNPVISPEVEASRIQPNCTTIL